MGTHHSLCPEAAASVGRVGEPALGGICLRCTQREAGKGSTAQRRIGARSEVLQLSEHGCLPGIPWGWTDGRTGALLPATLLGPKSAQLHLSHSESASPLENHYWWPAGTTAEELNQGEDSTQLPVAGEVFGRAIFTSFLF